MKTIKINTKQLFLALMMVGSTGALVAQTSPKTDSVKVTVSTAQVQTNPLIEGLKKQVEANPKDAESLAKLATAYQDATDWQNAIVTWKKISALLPDWSPSYYSQAFSYQSAKDDLNAKLSYEKYIATVKPEEIETSKKIWHTPIISSLIANKKAIPIKQKSILQNQFSMTRVIKML